VEPRYAWPDIVLPAEEIGLLHSIVSTVRHRSLVLEEWGLGKKLASSAGIAALFTGEPGTGKTLAAQVIAAELRQDLYRIDLSTVVIKKRGDGKNLDASSVRRTTASHPVLRRGRLDLRQAVRVKDAPDRYANIEVGYLLQVWRITWVTICHQSRTNIDEPSPVACSSSSASPSGGPTLRSGKCCCTGCGRGRPGLGIHARRYRLQAAAYATSWHAAFLAAQEDRQVGMQHLVRATRQEMKRWAA
jgi:hypothetical protein